MAQHSLTKPQEDRTMFVLSLVGNFPSKVPLCHVYFLRGPVEKNNLAELASKSNKIFTNMIFLCWEKKTVSSTIRNTIYYQTLWAPQETASKQDLI